MSDLVSIIMPTYNSGPYLRETIDSVRAQTYQNWELVITDDGSTDSTPQILEEYRQQDHRIRYFRLPHNQGPAKARNHSIAQAKGRFIAFLDSDDLWYPFALERLLHFRAEKNAAFVFAAYDISFGNGPVIETRRVPASIDYRGLLKDRPISCLTAIYDSEATGKMFMPDIIKRQDYGLWLALLKTGITAYGYPEPTARYRKRGGSVSTGNPVKSAWYVWKIFRDVEKLPWLESVYYFLYYFIPTLLRAIWRRMKQVFRRG